MTLPPGVRYSILRNKVEVPLIPIDQLPFYIQDLPRELTPFRKHQEGWTSIGETHESAVPLSIRAPPDMHSGSPSPSPDTNRQFLPPDHDVRRGPVVVSQDLKPLTELHPSSGVPAGGLVSRLVSTPPGRRPVSTTVEGSPLLAQRELRIRLTVSRTPLVLIPTRRRKSTVHAGLERIRVTSCNRAASTSTKCLTLRG